MNFSKKNCKRKKMGSVFLLSTLLLTLTLSCEKMPDTANETGGVTKEDVEAMKENHIIPLNDAVMMYENYSKDRVDLLKDSLQKKYGPNFNDTRTVWFDIKTIKAYLKYLEQNSSEAEGLQFYFSVYPDNGKKQKNHQTFFVAPTVKNIYRGDTIQSGYTKKDGKRVFIYEALSKYNKSSNLKKASFFSLLKDSDDGGYIFNEGNESPPSINN